MSTSSVEQQRSNAPSAAYFLSLARDYGVYLALIILFLVNLLITRDFLTFDNLRTQLVQVAPVVVVALGMALVIGTEGIDLSVGSVMAVAAALLPLYLGYGPFVAILVCLAAGAVAGLLSGSLVAFVGVAPIVATLALLVGGRGLALVIANGQLKQIYNQQLLDLGANDIFGVPYTVVITTVLVLIVAFLTTRTTFGRQLVAVGGNRKAAQFAGLPVRRVLLTVYILSGMLAATAGVLATARLTASDPSNLGLLMELSAITAVVVGGTPLSGGQVRVVGTVAGALLMQLITATLIKHDVSASITQMVEAAIILIAVLIQRERGLAR